MKPTTYTPGFAKPKVGMALLGLVLFSLAMTQLWTPLRLAVFGKTARAEATHVVKTKQGLPEQVLHDDLQIQQNLETRDRSYVFWNEFRFHPDDGSTVEVRAPIGSQLKPLYTLVDPDGLPTTDRVWYDPSHPETVVFPMIISTWFAPGVLAVAGTLLMVIGTVLRYWAHRPIELPHLASDPTAKISR